METLIRNDVVFFALMLIALVWGLVWTAMITIWPQGPLSARRKQQGRAPGFNAETLEGLHDLTLYMHSGLHNNGRGRNVEILLTLCWRLGQAGRLLSDQAQLQIERVCGRALRQIANDAQIISSEAQRLRGILQWLEALIEGIEGERVSDCLRALAGLFCLANGGWLENPPPDLPLSPELYRPFRRQLSRSFADPQDPAAFTKLLRTWRKPALEQDAYLFFLLRVLDVFRRPLYQLQYQPDRHLQSRERIMQWVETYLDALERHDLLNVYQALCYLVTEVQLLTEGETESTYIVDLAQVRRPRVLAKARPTPVTLRGQTPPRLPAALVPVPVRG